MLKHISIYSTVAVATLHATSAVSVQENYSICNWARLRAGVVRDALYLDGGLLWWQTAFVDGSTPVVSSDGNMAGDMYRLNFSIPFDTKTTNISALFDRLPKAGGAGNNIAPNYVDGTMFANNDELYLYGGLPRLTDSISGQNADAVLGYEAYQYGVSRDSWSPGFYQGSLTSGTTRYITNGAGASAPSENLGFYFSGMRSPNWGPIHYEDSSANATADTLIEVDMSTMRDEKWTNITLPEYITPRANAELVWIPVAEQGVLIAIGGVTSPEEIWAGGLNETQVSESEKQSPSLMTSLPIFDIASKTWYVQNTTGEHPGQLTEFCSVVAIANDSSSFNIYIYGGYDGLNADDQPSDDVWILSLPSFNWIKAHSGQSSHGRSSHRCVMPYPDKMLIIGGIHRNQANCVDGGIIQIFNLNTLQFQDKYSPDDWSEYKVPSVVSKAIGGSSRGGSKSVANWTDTALSGIFSKKYTKEIPHYYPYQSTNSTLDPPTNKGRSGMNHSVAIAIGIAAGLVLLVLLIVLLLIFRRKRVLRSTASSESTNTKHGRVSRWIDGTPSTSLNHNHRSDRFSEAPEVQPMLNSPHAISEAPVTSPSKRYEMAATEKPLPPFELATPYNNQDHPRHSGIVDYAYSNAHGHSQSTSSNYDNSQPSPAGSTTHLHVPPNSTPQSNFNSTNGNPRGQSSTLAWPFPAGPAVFQHTAPSTARYYSPSPSTSSGPSSLSQHTPAVPQIPPHYRQQPNHHHYTQPHQTQENPNSSVSSGLDTLPSPIGVSSLGSSGGGGSGGDDHRQQSLLRTTTTTVTAENGAGDLHENRVGSGPISPLSPQTMQGMETWWRRT